MPALIRYLHTGEQDADALFDFDQIPELKLLTCGLELDTLDYVQAFSVHILAAILLMA